MSSHQSRISDQMATARSMAGPLQHCTARRSLFFRVASVALGLVIGAGSVAGCGSGPDTLPPGGAGGASGAAGAGGSDPPGGDASHDDVTHPDGPSSSDAIVTDGRSSSDSPVSNDATTGRSDAADASKQNDAQGDSMTDAASPDHAPTTDATTNDATRTPDADGKVDAGSCGCAAYGSPTAVGTEPSTLTELSGIVASRQNPGVIYAHNDSGSSATLIIMSDTGASLGQILLSNVTAVDWEDIAVGPCDTGSCIFVGDIGDNNLAYASRAVYRFAEPTLSPTSSAGTVTVTADALTYVYPDARHNAETLLVDPSNGDIFVVTKVSNVASTVYRMPKPLTPGTQATMEKVGDLSLPGSAGLVTGGDIDPCGSHMLIRTYPMIYEFKLPAGQPFASIFATPGTAVATPTQDQESKGEGVTYAADGSGYFTASELDGKSTRSLFRVRCQ